MALERLQKILARCGIASRRTAETWVTEGRVRVNGKIISELGAKADLRRDRIEVDGKRVVAESFVYYVLNKPRGYVTTMHDPEGRPTIVDLLQTSQLTERVFPVGRLDFHTSGVLLLTNDGEFSNGLLHPRKDVPKTYVVKVQGIMKPEDLDRWRDGIELEDGKTLRANAALIRYEADKTWFEITIHEGRKNQLRRMGEATGFHVMRLSRVIFAGISVEGLRPGDVRSLNHQELIALKKEYGVPKHVSAPTSIKQTPIQKRSRRSSEETPRNASKHRSDEVENPSRSFQAKRGSNRLKNSSTRGRKNTNKTTHVNRRVYDE